MTASLLTFGVFQLDLATDRLSQSGRSVALTPRDLAVLRCLVVRSGQVVSTDEILESVWGDLFVTRGVVKVSIRRVRAALDDTAEQPTFIETVGRKGYRFIAPVQREIAAAQAEAVRADLRGAEFAQLHALFDRACRGRRQLLLVGGEAGVGKAKLVAAFLTELAEPAGALVAQGRCGESLGSEEPYLPFFEALRSLCRGPMAAEAVPALRRHAPLWLAQLPELVSPLAREALARESIGAEPARMLREFAGAAEAIASIRPLVLVLENVQGPDPGTLDLLAFLAGRRDAARLLVIATMGPDGLSARARSTLDRLLEQGVAEELVVSSPAEVAVGETTRVAHEPEWERLAHAPFVGRTAERARLTRRLKATLAGKGSVALVAGEPGIGKTRLLEELAEEADAAGAQVLRGRCFNDELARPYGPFAEAIAAYAQSSERAALREELGVFGGIAAKIAPELHGRVPDLPEPAALAPEEERARLLDAVAQVLWAIARRAPLVLVLDDLQWADGGTLALLRHLARFLPRHRLLILGAYRDVELGPRHPLVDAIAALNRDLDVERIALSGLGRDAVAELLEAVAKEPAPGVFVDALVAETAGNPLFLREILLHLFEDESFVREPGQTPWRLSVEEIGVPEGVREAIRRRLARLPEGANRLLATASGFAGPFRFDVAAAVAGLGERHALDALDSALAAQLLRAAGEVDTYEFTHAIIRHAIYTDLSASRQLRLHRDLAVGMERRCGNDVAAHAFEIAQQWHHSAALPGADRGVACCLLAADRAERATAHEDAAVALRMALDLAPPSDPRRPRLFARLGLVLAWSLAHEEAVRVASDAGEFLAATEGSDAAADYLADAADAVYSSTFDPRAWPLAEQGLRHVGKRRDLTWARLAVLDLDRRDASDPDFPGVPLDVAERHEASRVVVANWPSLAERGVVFYPSATAFQSRADASERGGALPVIVGFWAGEYERALAQFSALLPRLLERGQLAAASLSLLSTARFQLALGQPMLSQNSHARAVELVDRLGNPPFLGLQMGAIPLERAGFLGEGHERLLPATEQLLAHAAPENRWIEAMLRSASARYYAEAGRDEDALRAVEQVLPAIERAPGWAANYTAILWLAIEALWVLGRTEFADVLERNLRSKTLAPDFRYAHTDARLALARLCALTGRFDAARTAFGDARRVLEEQGARPLRAVTDFDEAWMEVRRGPAGDRDRARTLLDAARVPFEAMGMSGWLRRSDPLQQALASLSTR